MKTLDDYFYARDAFEAFYAQTMGDNGLAQTPEGIKAMRDGPGYAKNFLGEERHFLNSTWRFWCAAIDFAYSHNFSEVKHEGSKEG